MPFYCARSNLLLEESKNFILQKYAQRLHETIILVPNVYAANQLLKHFLSSMSVGLLPKIIPIEEIKVVGSCIISLDKSEFANYFEHQLIIANILAFSTHYNFSTRQSLDLSKSILVLLHEFIKSGREPKDLANLNCEHFLQLDTLAAFFQEVKDKWIKALSRDFLRDVVHSCIQNCNMLSLLISEGLFSFNLILIGIENPFAWELAKSMHNFGFDIIASSFSKGTENFSANFLNLLKFCDVTKQNVKELLFQESSAQMKPLKMSYKVFSNEIKELNFVIDLISAKAKQQECESIAVVIDDLEIIHTLVYTLRGYGICVKNLVGLSLTRNIVIDFLLLIGKLQSQEALVKDLIALLKHSYFETEIGRKFEHFVLDEGLILHSLEEALPVFESQCPQIYEICMSALFFDKGDSFQNLFAKHLKAAQRLFSGIWSCHEYGHVWEYLSNLFTASRHFEAVTTEEYCDILSKLLQGKFYEGHSAPSKVTILSPKDVIFLDSQFVIVPNFHDESWPSVGDSDVWLSSNIRSELGLSDVRSDQLENYRCYFEALGNFSEVLFTRACKVLGKETIPSRFLSKVCL